jgi:DNA repair protein SbcD/Mre11
LRILHTADWHLGLRLYKKELQEEQRKFFAWLLHLIIEREIDVLLISGDVFDQANPSNDTRKLYYEFLKQLIQVNCRVIITGGNHDSPGILNAPRDILEMLKIQVVGNVPDKIEDEVIEIKNIHGTLEALICAVPYIREQDIHRFTIDESFDDKRLQVSAGIRNHFQDLEKYCLDKYATLTKGVGKLSIPLIAMGHLYAAGSELSDSEREIQIGYQSPVTADDFPPGFDYIALGHIHRPQFVAKQKRIRYSGSPIALSFSEKADHKIVIELELNGNAILQTDHEVPAFRKLVKFSGSFEAVKKKIEQFKNAGEVQAWAELEIVEESVSPALQSAVSSFLADFLSDEIEILNHRITSNSANSGLYDLVDDHTQLEDLRPEMVLMKMMEDSKFSELERGMLLQAFLELSEMEEVEDEE